MRLSQKINKYPLLLLIAFLTGISVFGQTRNTITGKITDKKLNEYLPGAVVTLKGPSSHTTTTNANGQYLFVDIPKGSYQLSVTYINYNGFSADIDVPVTGTVKKDIDLISSTKDMATVTVVGSRFGQSKALNSQKEAMNIKNVVSEEQIERFPDMNTADVLQRVPGVTVQRSAGEGRFVGLRGTGPALTNVTVNGSLLATSNGTDRVVELDVINAGQLGGIEVTKVITPDMDANAIGGSINLKTRSAFDYKSRVFNVWAGVNNSAGAGFRSAINYSDKLGKNKKFGISLSASLTRTNRKETSNEQTWGDRTSTTNVALPMALRAMTIRQSNNTRDRLGLSGQLEYKFSGKSRIWINGMFNKRWDDQFRNDLTAKIDQGKYVSDTIVTGTRFIKSTQDRVERQKATAVEFGGINYAGKLKIEYQATYSAAYTKKSEGQIAPEFRYNNVNVKLTDLDTKFPNFGITDGKNIYNSGMYTHDVTDYRIENTTNELYTGGIDFTLPMNLAKKSTGELKFGARHRTNNKSRGDSRQQWSWKGAAPLNLAQFEDPNQMLGGVQDGHYNMGYAINTQKYREFFNANQSATGFVATDRPDVAFGEPYNADEKVTGVYAMASQTFGKLLVLG